MSGLNMDLLHILKLGWPVLSVLSLFSVISLSVFLQCWVVIGRFRRAVADGSVGKLELTEAYDLIDKRTALLGTIANASPFVGLLGTVIGIIRAFHSISVSSGGGVNVVAGGISEALVSTAAGLAVAIPASMVYNYFTFHNEKLARRAGLQ